MRFLWMSKVIESFGSGGDRVIQTEDNLAIAFTDKQGSGLGF